MALDATLLNPGRFRILVTLASFGDQDFVQLRQRTGLTDGNLSCHARRLQNAGLIQIDKSFRNGKPVTRLHLTLGGRGALADHAAAVSAAIASGGYTPGPYDPDFVGDPASAVAEDAWDRKAAAA